MKKRMGLLFVAALWLAISVWAWCKPHQEVSTAERRTLAQFPALTADFGEEFGDYAVDQFPLRDAFRSLKALAARFGFGQLDNNGIYIADGSAAEQVYPLDEASVDYAVQRFNDLYERYLRECDVTFAIVPDKGYYLGEASGHLTMDYGALFETMESALPWARFVDLTDCLTAESYYRTDTHWRQEYLFPVAQKLASALETAAPDPDACTQVTVERDFYGVYYGQAALPMEPDALSYLTWTGLEDCTVFSLDTGKNTAVYDLEKLDSNDLYDIFLSGGMALQTIHNPNGEKGRELAVFRDSFASSLIPLLVGEYETVTLIDTRYIAPELIGNYVNFEGKDVLMLYSTLVLNSSSSLRK